MNNPYAEHATVEASKAYRATRPDYPTPAVLAVLESPETAVRCVADIGSGTGIFARQLAQLDPGILVEAIEPSAAMRAQWVPTEGIRLHDATSEATGLADSSVDLVVWAQSFHWVDPEASGAEAQRILRQGGAAVVIANQMDVSVPWVHRLTRIMRSGDVHRVDRPPSLAGFATQPVRTFPWVQRLATDEVLQLARTRSSYLRAAPAQQQKMQQNLDWYLHEHLGYDRDGTVEIPYSTLVWILRENR